MIPIVLFGLGLFYGIQKFFEELEKKLSDNTKLEIAVWLLESPPTKAIQNWRSTFLKIFNRVFGEKHLSWKCFWRSCLTTAAVTLVVMLGRSLFFSPKPRNVSREALFFVVLFLSGAIGSALPDYISLWKTRCLINLSRTIGTASLNFLFLAIDVVLTSALAVCAAFIGTALTLWIGVFVTYGTPIPIGETIAKTSKTFFLPSFWTPMSFAAVATIWFIPAFFGRVWLLVYVGCGLLLKISSRLDIGFAWFNRRFDIEKHPLQCIGLVAGACSALGYWILAAIHVLA